MMSKLWAILLLLSFICAIATGKINDISVASLSGAEAAIELCLSISGLILLWSGIMEIMKRCGLMDALSKLINPIACRLFPSAKNDKNIIHNISTNMSANLLGLGNAATPAGIRAAEGLHRISRAPYASDDMCMLVIINTASLQLIPTTIGAIRSAAGASNPFDIMPAVWFASAFSLLFGIAAAKLFSKFYRR